MDRVTWEFDGRCLDCGSEELTEILDDTIIITKCENCGKQFIVEININDAIYY